MQQSQQKENYDKSHKAKDLPPLQPKSEVWITSGAEPTRGRVVSDADTPRSYMVNTPTGLVRRTRQHLNIVPEQTQTDQSEVPESTQEVPRSPIRTRSRTGTPINPPDRLGI